MLQRPLINSECIIVGGRRRVFRSQTIVWRQYGASGCARQVGSDDAMGGAGPQENSAAGGQDDKGAGVPARGQDHLAVTRSAVHMLDLDVLRRGQLPATPSIHVLISAGVAFAGGGFWA